MKVVYLKIEKLIRTMINSSDFEVGQALPSERELSHQFKVSRSTVRKAISQLVGAGLVGRKHGSSNFVLKKDPTHDNFELRSFTEHMRNMGRETKTKVVKFEMRPSTNTLSKILKIREGAMVYFVRRIRYTDDYAIEVEDSYLPLEIYRNITIDDLETSKYSFIENKLNYQIKGCSYSFDSIIEDDTSEILGVRKGTPLLKMICISNSVCGVILDYSEITSDPKTYKVDFYVNRVE